MYRFLIILLFCNWAVADTSLSKEQFDEAWEDWKIKYGKYEGVPDKYLPAEKANFKRNLQTIMQHNQEYNQGKSTFMAGLNRYSDMSYRQILKFRTGFAVSRLSNGGKSQESSIEDDDDNDKQRASNFPISKAIYVNWTADGVVTAVKDQGICNSGWAFATTGALESHLAIYRRDVGLTSLSEQYLVDCDYFNFGCDGGNPYNSLYYTYFNGIVRTADYPSYESETETCAEVDPKTKISVYGYDQTNFFLNGNEKLLKAAVNLGPIAVAIQITKLMTVYKGGIFYDPLCTTEPNHAVLITGYGTENGTDYWMIKNSWGESFGENGYIRIARNKNNHCGIAVFGGAPIVVGPNDSSDYSN